MKKNISGKMGVIFLMAISALIISGCAAIGGSSSGTSSSSMQQGGAAMSGIVKFDDIPVPAGFKLIDNESFTFQNDQMRVGLLKYAGMPNANKVVEFYKEQMPMYNWDLINVIEYGQKVMNFERRDQSCIITVQPFSTKTVVAVAIAPKASTTMTEEKVQKYKELKIK